MKDMIQELRSMARGEKKDKDTSLSEVVEDSLDNILARKNLMTILYDDRSWDYDRHYKKSFYCTSIKTIRVLFGN
jgi:hypothetical protein